ncbi:MAG: rRNA pseudouridine synthase [Clostridiales bacterium]|nr:rRNA pseudouridine synthase [Clostridiales bacterium]
MRLQKYMADAGVASRRACEQLILGGRVTVNGTVAHLGMTVEEGDQVLFDGNPLAPATRRVVVLLYKPRGVVCTSSDPEGRRTVQDYFKDVPERLYNVGRLDLNSEGLLLLTNDGELANRMMHPRFGITKTYYVVCEGKLTASQLHKLTNGVELDDGPTAPAIIRNVRPTPSGGTALSITIREGRNRQIRRMIEAVGHKTLRLKREAYGPLTLGALRPGQWRYLTDSEIEQLYTASQIKQ